MKKTILLSLLFMSSLALAAQSNHGPYLGGQIGHIDTHTGKFGTDWTAYRLFGGWRFDESFAVEGGYNHLFNNENGRLRGYDLVGKAIVPLAHNFDMYIKAGGMYTSQDLKTQADKSKLLPLIGIGAGFNIIKGLNVDASYSYSWGYGGIGDIDFAALGLSYTFNVT